MTDEFFKELIKQVNEGFQTVDYYNDDREIIGEYGQYLLDLITAEQQRRATRAEDVQRAIEDEKVKLQFLFEISPTYGKNTIGWEEALNWERKIHEIKITALEQMKQKEIANEL